MKNTLKDDPLHLRALTALLLFIVFMPLIIAGMLTIGAKDVWKRRKHAPDRGYWKK